MLVVVDTSVWVAYFRRAEQVVERTLDELIDADLVAMAPPVRLELILGCRKSQRASLVRRIDALHPLAVTDRTWNTAERFSMQMRDTGITLGPVDVLIAAVTTEHHARLWTLDKDFVPLFEAEFVEAFRPPWRPDA